jgi:NADPH2 dehydrogenase
MISVDLKWRKVAMADIFSEFKVKDMLLKNRVVMAPMCMYSSDDNGKVKPFHHFHYGTRAVGGAALIMLEATAIEKRGRISDQDLGLWSDDQVEEMRKLVDHIHSEGARVGVQLAHAGRKSTTGEDIISASPLIFSLKYEKPREMTSEDIETVIESFGQAARRAYEAGFDIVEIHGAHGYLINQFLSPLSNQRSDKYGGGVENRARLLTKVIKRVRESWPEEKPLCLRVSGYEYNALGNLPEDVSFIINIVKDYELDLINVSSGGIIDTPVESYPGYQIAYGTTIKNLTRLPVMVGGLLEHHHMANEIIRNNRGDLIYLGRELLRNPYWVLQSARKLENDDVVWPKQYERAK